MESGKVVNIDNNTDEEFERISKQLNSKGIKDVTERLAYIKEVSDGPVCLYFMFKELDNSMLSNYNSISKDYNFSKAAIDGLLRSYLFILKYMKTSLPQHAYDHVKNKSNSFVFQLEQQLKNKNTDFFD